MLMPPKILTLVFSSFFSIYFSLFLCVFLFLLHWLCFSQASLNSTFQKAVLSVFLVFVFLHLASLISFWLFFFFFCTPLVSFLSLLLFFSLLKGQTSLSLPCHILNGENIFYLCTPFPRKYYCRKIIKQRVLCYCLPERYPSLVMCGISA